MKIVHTIFGVGPNSFGLGPVALNLAMEQGRLGVDSQIWCVDNENDRQWASSSSGLADCNIRPFRLTGPRMAGYCPVMERAAAREADSISVMHQHAIWTGISRVTNLLRQSGIPTVITPHGSLEKWAVGKSWWKKRIALSLYERSNLRSASCLHVVGNNEITDCRDFGLRNPVALIPNGVAESWLRSKGNATNFINHFHISPDKRVLLFLSRVTPKKGLPMFLDVLHGMRTKFSDWTFIIAGSDEFGHTEELKNLIIQNRLEESVTVTGPVYGQIKRDAFAAAELFVLPSFSEGSPLVILEALGAGVPVLTTKASPWQDLVQHNCGWWVDISKEAIGEALDDALKRSPEQLKHMGQCGNKLVGAQYNWTRSAQMTIELYEWLLGRKERPDFVIVD